MCWISGVLITVIWTCTRLASSEPELILLQQDSVPTQSHSSLDAIHGPASYSSLSRGPGSFFSEFSGDLTHFFTAAGPSKQAFQPAGADFSQTQSADTHGLSGLSFSPEFGHTSLSGFQQGCGPQVSVCQKSKYRSLDGTCNNPYKPTWGAANTPYARVKPAKYADGVQDPPVSQSGKPLPGARLVSAVLFPDSDIPDPKWTLIAMQWGQIITHDLSQAAGTTQAKAHSTNCCSEDKAEAIPKEYRDPSCFPIEVLHDDPHYAQHSQQCMNFVRTTTDLSQGCSQPFKPAEQIVAVTHFMDCSIIYGSSKQQTDSLREWKGGRLRMEYRHGKGFPPSSTNKSSICDHISEQEACYVAGDSRVNQNPQLTILHVVLIREHNRVAGHLNKLNPHWDDNKLFHEARRIVIAEHQHISYYEWLPIFLGWESTKHHGLTYDTHDYTHDYSEHVDPSVINGHATAAFRYFHTNIAGYLHLVSEHRSSYSSLRLSDHFNRPEIIEEGENFDHLIRGMTTQSQECTDQYFTSEITRYLFRNGKETGQDLRAIDIQRGRDHGLASYNDYRHYCGLHRADKFSDFGDYISQENIVKLSHLYEHPDDVDYVVGGSLEAHVNGALSGPSFLCVMVEQFYRTRAGDKFFYENGDHHHSFTHEQLNEIRKSSISRLLCDNGDDIFSMQPKGFQKISHDNFVVHCKRDDVLPVVNLGLWKDHNQHK